VFSSALKVTVLCLCIGLAPRLAVAIEDEDEIRAFLEAHPEFLLEHPELVDMALAEQQSRQGKEEASKRLEILEQLKAFSGIAVADAAVPHGYQVVFFGFTHCPDICPTALFNIAEALSMLGASASAVHPLFISVDPVRDNAQALADYVAYFNGGFTGLTGSSELLASAQDAFAARSEKVVLPNDDDGNYGFNHSSWIFLVDSQGRILTRFSADSDPAAMARSIQRFMNGGPDQ
jgi:protein SCO1/2